LCYLIIEQIKPNKMNHLFHNCVFFSLCVLPKHYIMSCVRFFYVKMSRKTSHYIYSNFYCNDVGWMRLILSDILFFLKADNLEIKFFEWRKSNIIAISYIYISIGKNLPSHDGLFYHTLLVSLRFTLWIKLKNESV